MLQQHLHTVKKKHHQEEAPPKHLIIATATDAAGNASRCCRTVTVTLDQSKASVASVAAQAAAARAYCEQNGTAPPGYFVIGDGPVVGPKQ